MDFKFKLDVIGAVSSSIALVITIISLIVLILRLPPESSTWLVITFCGSNILLTILFVSLNFHVSRRLFTMNEISKENYDLNTQIKANNVEIKNTPETLSSLIYYNELLWLKMNKLVDESMSKDNLNTDFINFCNDLDTYLHSFTSCLQSFFSQMTGEKCSVTLKITKTIDGVNYVRTLYRDPMSLQKRQQNDRKSDGTLIVYRVEDNSGFKAIINNKIPNDGFYCDNLSRLEYYHNGNSRWKHFYNATAVEPITIKKQQFIVKGFLCVDNYGGKLSKESLKSVLEANAIQLYSIFEKFEKISEHPKIKIISHELRNKFTDWNISR